MMAFEAETAGENRIQIRHQGGNLTKRIVPLGCKEEKEMVTLSL